MALAKSLHVEQGETRASGAIAPQVRYIEMFGGVGGFRLGLESVDNDIEQHYSKWNSQFKNVGYYEWDKYAVATYNANFGGGEVPTDVTKVEADDFPDHDILTGGFPCQAFSIAGQRRGFEDTRGTMFFEITRVAQAKRPRLLLLENVRGLLSHDKGRTFRTILETLDDLGYDVQWEVLNSKNFGVPQNRERIFIIGHLRGQPRPQIFPLGSDAGQVLGLHEGEGEAARQPVTCLMRNQRGGVRVNEYACALPAQHGGQNMVNIVAPANEIENAKADQGIKVVGNVFESGGQNGAVYDPIGIAPTLRSGQGVTGNGVGSCNSPKIIVAGNTKLRKLTPRECARLQGFPDWFEFPVSDTQAYKQMGNAVTVNVVREIGKELLAYFNQGVRA